MQLLAVILKGQGGRGFGAVLCLIFPSMVVGNYLMYSFFVTVGILSEIFIQGNSIEKLLLNSVIVNWSFKHS